MLLFDNIYARKEIFKNTYIILRLPSTVSWKKSESRAKTDSIIIHEEVSRAKLPSN